jgi:hypothetical protein
MTWFLALVGALTILALAFFGLCIAVEAIDRSFRRDNRLRTTIYP